MSNEKTPSKRRAERRFRLLFLKQAGTVREYARLLIVLIEVMDNFRKTLDIMGLTYII